MRKRELLKTFSKDIARHLGSIGMQKRSGDIFTLELSSDIIGWIGLNRAIQYTSESIAINPVVGVRHQEIERLIAECSQVKFHPYIPPTLSVNLGYILPEKSYREYEITGPDQINTQTESISESIRKYGVAFMRAHDNIAIIVSALQSELFRSMEYSLPRLIVGYYLLGSLTESLVLLEKLVQDLTGRDDQAAIFFGSFATNMRKLIERSL